MGMKEWVVRYHAHFFSRRKTALQAQFSRVFRFSRPQSGKQVLNPSHEQTRSTLCSNGRVRFILFVQMIRKGYPG